MDKVDYTRIYSKWHSGDPGHIKKMKDFHKRTIGRFLPEDKKAAILDIGCAMGFTLMMLDDEGYDNAEGIDTDSKLIEFCREKRLKAKRVDDSAAYLNKKKGSYDLVLALDLIEHIPHKKQPELVKAVSGSLKKGGKLICTVPNANSMLASRWRYNCWTHENSFTEHSLDFLLHNGGFRDIQVTGTEAMPRPRHMWIIRKSVIRWWLLKLLRARRKLEYIAELGYREGIKIPMTLNLLGTGVKKADDE